VPGSNRRPSPCTLQCVHKPVSLLDWRDRASLTRATHCPLCFEHLGGRVPRRVGRDASPVGSCAESASTRNDARRGSPARRTGGVMTDDTRWFVGIDRASQTHQSLPDRCRRQDYRRASVCPRRRRAGGTVRLAADDDGGRTGGDRSRDRGAPRFDRLDAARTRFPGRRGQSQAARPVPRPLHRGRGQGRLARCACPRRFAAH
jgi:hypothetical protein